MESWLWTQKQDIGPSPRYYSSMAYDSSLKRIVLFGVMMVRVTRIHGSGRNIDGHRWQTRDHRLDTATLAYDSLRKKITLFGGYCGTMRGDT
jgi:hypothetical protein